MGSRVALVVLALVVVLGGAAWYFGRQPREEWSAGNPFPKLVDEGCATLHSGCCPSYCGDGGGTVSSSSSEGLVGSVCSSSSLR